MTVDHLFIDDERKMPPQFGTLARTTGEAIAILEQAWIDGDPITTIGFDHDMGFRDPNVEYWTTRPALEWIIEHNFWPLQIFVHSFSPAGAAWLVARAKEAAPEGVHIERVNENWYYQ